MLIKIVYKNKVAIMLSKKASQTVLSLFFKQTSRFSSAPLVKSNYFVTEKNEAQIIIAEHQEVNNALWKYMSAKRFQEFLKTGEVRGYVTTEQFTTGKEAEQKLQIAQEWSDGPIEYAIPITNDYARVIPAKPDGGKLEGVGFEVFTECYPQHGTGGAVQGILEQPVLIDQDTIDYGIKRLQANGNEEHDPDATPSMKF